MCIVVNAWVKYKTAMEMSHCKVSCCFQCLHDISTVKGQLVVLECRIRGTPPLQVLWFREEEQILDSADFRILRKSVCSLSQHCSVL